MASKVQGTNDVVVLGLGEYILNVSDYKKFLSKKPSILAPKVLAELVRCYERCMNTTEQPKILNVHVVEITADGLAHCEFFCRGPRLEHLFAPADCLKPVKHVNLPKNITANRPAAYVAGQAI